MCVYVHPQYKNLFYMLYKIYIRKTWNIESMYKTEEYLDYQQHLYTEYFPKELVLCSLLYTSALLF